MAKCRRTEGSASSQKSLSRASVPTDSLADAPLGGLMLGRLRFCPAVSQLFRAVTCRRAAAQSVRRCMTHLLPVRPTYVGRTDLTSQGAPKSVSFGESLDEDLEAGTGAASEGTMCISNPSSNLSIAAPRLRHFDPGQGSFSVSLWPCSLRPYSGGHGTPRLDSKGGLWEMGMTSARQLPSGSCWGADPMISRPRMLLAR